jgi:hypothetical protein
MTKLLLKHFARLPSFQAFPARPCALHPAVAANSESLTSIAERLVREEFLRRDSRSAGSR